MKNAARRKHHYVYMITCTLNSKWYIGIHSTDNLDDGYFGSGTELARSIRRHGRDCHVMDILEHHDTREAIRKREAELVTLAEVFNDECMNLVPGGQGGWTSEQMKTLWSNPAYIAKQRSRTHSGHTDATVMALHEAAVKQWADPVYRAWKTVDNRKSQQLAVQAALTDEARAKRKATLAEKKHSQGASNPNFGKRWMRNPETGECQSVKKNDAQPLLDIGWVYGRT